MTNFNLRLKFDSYNKATQEVSNQIPYPNHNKKKQQLGDRMYMYMYCPCELPAVSDEMHVHAIGDRNSDTYILSFLLRDLFHKILLNTLRDLKKIKLPKW